MVFKVKSIFIILVSGLINISLYAKTQIIFNEEDNIAITDLRQVLVGYEAGIIKFNKVAIDARTGQDFYLAISNKQTEIKYTTDNSLQNAVYTLLDIWGFRWYGPGENWFIKPKVINIKPIAGKWYTPSFRNRSFFGTGGLDFPFKVEFDLDNNYKQQWYAFKRRNRFNADFTAVGHMGQLFYQENKTVIDNNPNWFANNNGAVNGRIKIDNKQAVNTYITWAKNKYKPNLVYNIIGVDPEDGRGGSDDPLPSNMPNINNHADKWWWLANEVAKQFNENDKRTVVSMYAYGDGKTNALAPNFKLRKNVYPTVIPYAFQGAYSSPENMIKDWASKINGTMGIYDYWNITQWSLGMPQFNIYGMQQLLKYWKNNKIDGIYLETTDAAGPMGHVHWLSAQLQWDVNKNFEQLYGQYLNDCFGKAAPEIKSMFDRWSKNYQKEIEVPASIQNLINATKLVEKNSAEWKRINELKAYILYMKMFYAHDGTQDSKDKIMNYLYSIHHLMLVQTAAFMGQAYITPFQNGNKVPNGKNIKKLTANDIEELFNDNAAFAKNSYKSVEFIFDYNKVSYTDAIPNESWRFGSGNTQFSFKAKYSGNFNLEVGAESNTIFQFLNNRVEILNETVGKDKFDKIEELSGRKWHMKKYTISIKKDSVYTITCKGGFNRVVILDNKHVLFKNPSNIDFDNYQYPIQYFYVPKQATEIIFTDAEPEGLNGRGYLIMPNGKSVNREATIFKNTYKVAVPAEAKGKVWAANFGHPSFKFVNIPNYTSLQKFTYTE
jgi:hypothetical protein